MIIPYLAIAGFLVALNLFTLLRFWQDKQRAVSGQRRIPEVDLICLALIGGSLGALAARWMFRHKTRKQPFSTWLFAIAGLQLGAAIALIAMRI